MLDGSMRRASSMPKFSLRNPFPGKKFIFSSWGIFPVSLAHILSPHAENSR